jgi:hypothetical protein
MTELSEHTLLLLELIHCRQTCIDELFYDKLYETITGSYRSILIQYKPREIVDAIDVLVNYYELREEYEKCSALHKLGFEIYNTIT